MGFAVNDPRIPEAIRVAEELGVEIEFEEQNLGDVHPNTVRIVAKGESREIEILGSSIGAAAIEVFRISGFSARFKGDSPTLFLFYRDRPAMIHQVTEIIADEGINIAALSCSRKRRGKDAFMQIDVDSPMSRNAMQHIVALEDVTEARFLDRIP